MITGANRGGIIKCCSNDFYVFPFSFESINPEMGEVMRKGEAFHDSHGRRREKERKKGGSIYQ